jgi:hypothetical protein
MFLPLMFSSFVQAGMEAALNKLAPYLLPFTLTERHDLPKMRGKTLSFVEKAQDYAHQYSALCPSYLDLTRMTRI